MTSVRETTLSFNYSDRFSTLMLWWKAFMLLPVWAYPALPFVASIVNFFGLLAITFVAVILGGVIYFIEDVLKRKVRIEHGYIVHGLRSRNLSQLLSIGTGYKRNEVLPKKMIMTFGDGRNMEFRLSRINSPDYQRFLRYIETNYPQCQVDPVLQTLISCKKVARKVLIDDSDRFMIEYKSERLFYNLWRAFFDTAHPWLRIGPVFIVIFMIPTWNSSVSSMMLAPIGWNHKGYFQEMQGHLGRMFGDLWRLLFETVGTVSVQIVNVLGNPLIAAASFAILMYLIVFYGARIIVKPNSLFVDKDGLNLAMSVLGRSRVIDRIKWKNVDSVGMERKPDGKMKIIFRMITGKSFEIDFSSVAENDRPRLIKALERFAPGCSIDSDLNEAMMPHHERSYTELWLQSLSSSPERNSLQSLTPGQKLENDRYVVVRRLGVGGQGTAYLCKDLLNNSEVVLKETVIPVFAERAIKEQALRRFDHEAKILKSLDCEYIVALRDHFFEDHRGYLVLEHIPGKTLRQLVDESGALSQERVAALARQMCLILSYLHERDIIHRDFTPDNLILTDDGRLKLIDFNVAQSNQVGTTGTIAGKHAYLPPEQFRGKATTQSDIYAMGATLFYLLAGQDPEPISQSIPSTAGVEIDNGLDQLIADCTALDCAKRCSTIQIVEKRLLGDSGDSVPPEPESTIIDVSRSEEKQPVPVKGES